MKATLIIVDGPDCSGKSTLINTVLSTNKTYKLLEFPKALSSGQKFMIDTENELEIYTSMLSYLDPKYKYIQDRGVISNIIYGSSNVDIQESALSKISKLVNLKLIIVDREQTDQQYTDDLIDIDPEKFNIIIDKYRSYYPVDKSILCAHTQILFDDKIDDTHALSLFK